MECRIARLPAQEVAERAAEMHHGITVFKPGRLHLRPGLSKDEFVGFLAEQARAQLEAPV